MKNPVAVKTEYIEVLSHTTNTKNQHFATTTLKLGLAKCSVFISYLICCHPLVPGTTRQGDKTGTSQSDTLDQSLRAQPYIIPRRSHGQITKVPGHALHIPTEYSANSRNRTPLTKVSLHIRKPKPQASVEKYLNQSINWLNVCNTIQKYNGGM